jgi:predicted peptidase
LPTGETLRYGVSIPEGYDGKKPVPLIVALHYAGDVEPYYGKGMMDGLIQPGLKEAGAVIVAPDAQGGEDWTSERNEQTVIWLTRSVMKTYAIDPKKVLLTGFSMGGIGTWHIAGRHQDLFTAAIPIAGKPAAEGTEWKIPLYVVHSKNDDVLPYDPVEKHVKALKEKEVNVLLAPVEGLGHYETNAYAVPLSGAMGWLMQVWKGE